LNRWRAYICPVYNRHKRPHLKRVAFSFAAMGW